MPARDEKKQTQQAHGTRLVLSCLALPKKATIIVKDGEASSSVARPVPGHGMYCVTSSIDCSTEHGAHRVLQRGCGEEHVQASSASLSYPAFADSARVI